MIFDRILVSVLERTSKNNGIKNPHTDIAPVGRDSTRKNVYRAHRRNHRERLKRFFDRVARNAAQRVSQKNSCVLEEVNAYRSEQLCCISIPLLSATDSAIRQRE